MVAGFARSYHRMVRLVWVLKGRAWAQLSYEWSIVKIGSVVKKLFEKQLYLILIHCNIDLFRSTELVFGGAGSIPGQSFYFVSLKSESIKTAVFNNSIQ